MSGSPRLPALLPLPLPARAAVMPDHPALIVEGRAIGYGALDARADDLARRLAALAVGEGDRVAVLLARGAWMAVALHACGRLGAILVPLNSRLTAREIDFQLHNTTPKVLLADPRFADTLATGADPAEAGQPRVVWLDDADEEPVDAGNAADAVRRSPPRSPPRLPSRSLPRAPGAIALRDVIPATVALRDAVAADAPQAIVHTSGTTGAPKGAVLTWGNQAWSAAGSALRLGAAAGDRWLAVLPLFHVGGLAILLRAAWQGATVVVHERFDVGAVRRALGEEGITMVSLVPTMLARVLGDDANAGSADGAASERVSADFAPAPTLRVALIGGGAASGDFLTRAARAGWPLALTYGLTEACSQAATTPPGWRPEDGVAAAALPFTDLRVVDAAGAPLPPGAEGEILVRGPTVFAGYWRDAPASARAVDAAGWLRTGDLGRLDARGRIAVSGRRSDLIVSGGENVYPAEVEAVLEAHPTVAEACVVGLPDPSWGERVVAAVVAARTVSHTGAYTGAHAAAQDGHGTGDDAGDEAGDDAALLAFARTRLAGFKLPRELRWVEALPRTASGKLRRAAVRAAWRAPAGMADEIDEAASMEDGAR